ncbi:MAG: MoxR family ATPase [Deltaproteobacteria bacterium]|nr:MoxR family ATPase [Deltaproteobacteria bacterium]
MTSFRRFAGTQRYIADEGLMASVNAAVVLERPLLVKGEPGTGKTLLATAVADALNKPLFTWYINSRFGDHDVSDIRQYIKLGILGRAFDSEEQVVLLIDEIDKADIEFPNDLLRELDEMRFDIPELDETVMAKHRPIVVITSNAEKELPDAFLRRCVFHFIAFPDRGRMQEIVRVHHPRLDDALLDAALNRFFAFRKVGGLRKPPSTSELIDWLTVLVSAGVDPDDVLNSDPFLGVLFKQEQDVAAAMGRRRRPY